MMRWACAAVALACAGCAAPERITQAELEAGIATCKGEMRGEVEVTVSEDGHSATVSCVRYSLTPPPPQP